MYRVGKSVAAKQLVLIYARSAEPGVRVGFSVNKRIGNSVARNRVKRRLRAAFDPLIPHVSGGYNLIFIAREPVVAAQFAVVASCMRYLLTKAGLLKRENA